MIRNRLEYMGRAALVRHSEYLNRIQIKEPVVYDGLENFASSQYDINHIQHAIGARSFFIYDFSYAPLNRKGTMTQIQKVIGQCRDDQEGRYPPDAIKTTTRQIWRRLLDRVEPGKCLEIKCDAHPQYRGALKNSSSKIRVECFKGKKEGVRGYRNPLFTVDHADLLIRQQVSAFRRETIAFSKTPIAMIWKYAIFMAWKNYMRPIFTKSQPAHRKWMQKTTPAMALGIGKKPFKFDQVFARKAMTSIPNNLEWNYFFSSRDVPIKRAPYQEQLVLVW